MEKEKKIETKPVDHKVLVESINKIVDQLHVQAGSRDVVNEIVKELKTEYGIGPKVSRKVATIVYKQNLEEVDEETQEIADLIDEFNS